jgi:hypothetical protein
LCSIAVKASLGTSALIHSDTETAMDDSRFRLKVLPLTASRLSQIGVGWLGMKCFTGNVFEEFLCHHLFLLLPILL